MFKTADLIDETIAAYLKALNKMGVTISSAYLYGSQAEGTADSDSDIDLIVVSPVFSNMPLWQRLEILGDALAEVMKPIEVIAYSPSEFEMKKNVKTSFLHHILAKTDTKKIIQKQ
ncbi:nucleotidyltransferase domain-containing protein [Zhaonella formicivorans]|uniref:nucleotidyltransferase domain-containing protein n=1 Tax=Zhaonella formicivorans TaxID=2528593 RepID=UPI001D107734|nr:nucleotidyltransferase domain-containing protein [Zhaonella formicivorans]